MSKISERDKTVPYKVMLNVHCIHIIIHYVSLSLLGVWGSPKIPLAYHKNIILRQTP